MLVGVSRKFEDKLGGGCFVPSSWADDSIGSTDEPDAAEGAAENVTGFEVSPLKNSGEKASGLLWWELESPLYVERGADGAFLRIRCIQARRDEGAVEASGRVPFVKSRGMCVTEIYLLCQQL